MSVSMQIKSSEIGVVRVFHVDLPPEAVERFTTQAGTGEWPLQYALGAKKLRPGFVDVIAIRDLEQMPLSQYLAQAYDLSGPDFNAMRGQLDAMTGHVVALPSTAFDRTGQTLTIAMPLRWVATFNEPKPDMIGAPIDTASARGTVTTTKAKPSAGGGGVPGWVWIAMVALMLLVLALFGLAG